MAKISTYVIDSTPQLNDKVIGTDVNDNNITKNYTIGDIISLFPVVTNLFVPISNGVDYVDSVITQDSTTSPTKINVNGLIGITGTGQSVYIGDGAGVSDAFTFGKNVGVGNNSLQSFTSGLNPVSGQGEDGVNVAIGSNALQATTTGTNNVGIGGGALAQNITGFNNVAISKNALGKDDPTVAMSTNDTSIGIGFAAGMPKNTVNITGHSGGTYVGHQAAADGIFGNTPLRNVALGFRALRNFGNPADETTLEDNVVIGPNTGLGIVAPSGGAGVLLMTKNILIGRNAGNGVVSANFNKNILIGGSGTSAKYVGQSNVLIESGGSENAYGIDTTNNESAPISNNFVVGGNLSLFGNENIVINPNSGIQVNKNIVGAIDADKTTLPSSYTNNLVLGGGSVSNNKIQSTIKSAIVANNEATFNSIIQSVNTTVNSDFDSATNLVGKTNNNFIVNGADNTIQATGLTSSDNILIGNTNLSLTNSNENFIVGASDSTLMAYENISNNFLFNTGNGSSHSTLGQNAEKNVIFNSSNSEIGENRTGNVILSGQGEIEGDNNVVLNGSCDIGAGNSSGFDRTVDESVVFGDVDLTRGTRVFAYGQGIEINGLASEVKNIFLGGQNVEIDTLRGGAGTYKNTFGFGEGLIVDGQNSFVIGKYNDFDSGSQGGSGPPTCLFQVGAGTNSNNRQNALNIAQSNFSAQPAVIYSDILRTQNYVDDAAAAAAGIGLGGLYHSSGVVKIRIT